MPRRRRSEPRSEHAVTSLSNPSQDPPAEEEERSEADSKLEFGAALEAFESAQAVPPRVAQVERRAAPKSGGPRVGSRVTGRVVSVSEDAVLVDVGGRSEGIADAREFRPEDGGGSPAHPPLEVGQTLSWVVVEIGEPLRLSRGTGPKPRVRGGKAASLAALRQAREGDLPVQGRVTGVNKGGLTVDVDGARAFCPLSQVDVSHVQDAASFVGRSLEFLVLEVDEARARAVLSRRRWLAREKESQRRERMATLVAGQEIEGSVTRIEPYGAFVDLGGVEGLVHVSEISASRVAHPGEKLALGDTVRVRVLRVEPEKRRIALSIRRTLAPEPPPSVVAPVEPRPERDSARRERESARPERESARPERESARPERESAPPAGNRPKEPEPLTPMQLAFRRAREAQRRREGG